ncbi:phage integrase N-terminal SAM-like domain-containing protein [Acidobacteriota bacterium]
MSKRPKKLKERFREVIRRKHYSLRTEQAYAQWIRRFICFHKKHPALMREKERAPSGRAQRIAPFTFLRTLREFFEAKTRKVV